MGWFSDVFGGGGSGGSFGINLGINPAEWFGEDRPDEIRAETRQHDDAMQREFAQNAIQWRVNDAKAAGLHPLFGLQGNNATFSPSAVVGGSGEGSSIGFSPGAPPGARGAAEARQQIDDQRDLNERGQQDNHARTLSMIATDTEQQGLLRAQADLARQQLKDSIDARAGQAGRVNKERSMYRPNPVVNEDASEVEPRKITSASSTSGGAIGAGQPGPAFEPVWLAPGIPALVPSGAAQNLGDMEFSGWAIAIAATALWWGDAAAAKVWDLAKKAGHHVTRSHIRSIQDSRFNAPTDRRQSVHPH